MLLHLSPETTQTLQTTLSNLVNQLEYHFPDLKKLALPRTPQGEIIFKKLLLFEVYIQTTPHSTLNLKSFQTIYTLYLDVLMLQKYLEHSNDSTWRVCKHALKYSSHKISKAIKKTLFKAKTSSNKVALPAFSFSCQDQNFLRNTLLYPYRQTHILCQKLLLASLKELASSHWGQLPTIPLFLKYYFKIPELSQHLKTLSKQLEYRQDIGDLPNVQPILYLCYEIMLIECRINLYFNNNLQDSMILFRKAILSNYLIKIKNLFSFECLPTLKNIEQLRHCILKIDEIISFTLKENDNLPDKIILQAIEKTLLDSGEDLHIIILLKVIITRLKKWVTKHAQKAQKTLPSLLSLCSNFIDPNFSIVITAFISRCSSMEKEPWLHIKQSIQNDLFSNGNSIKNPWQLIFDPSLPQHTHTHIDRLTSDLLDIWDRISIQNPVSQISLFKHSLTFFESIIDNWKTYSKPLKIIFSQLKIYLINYSTEEKKMIKQTWEFEKNKTLREHNLPSLEELDEIKKLLKIRQEKDLLEKSIVPLQTAIKPYTQATETTTSLKETLQLLENAMNYITEQSIKGTDQGQHSMWFYSCFTLVLLSFMNDIETSLLEKDLDLEEQTVHAEEKPNLSISESFKYLEQHQKKRLSHYQIKIQMLQAPQGQETMESLTTNTRPLLLHNKPLHQRHATSYNHLISFLKHHLLKCNPIILYSIDALIIWILFFKKSIGPIGHISVLIICMLGAIVLFLNILKKLQLSHYTSHWDKGLLCLGSFILLITLCIHLTTPSTILSTLVKLAIGFEITLSVLSGLILFLSILAWTQHFNLTIQQPSFHYKPYKNFYHQYQHTRSFSIDPLESNNTRYLTPKTVQPH